MRIAVNTRLLIKNRLEGIGRFSLEILSRIAQNHPEHDFLFIFDRPYDKKFIFADNVKPIVIGPQARHPFLFIFWFEVSIPFILRKYKADMFLSPDGFLSLRSKIPQLAVIHDINFEHYPQDLPKIVLWYYKKFFPKFIRKATKIITVSEFSKSDLIKTYPVDEAKVSVVYNGVKKVYAPISESEKQSVKKKYTDGFNYFLYVGALHPRKNLVNLFKAFDRYRSENNRDTKLLVVGNKMWWTADIKKAYEKMVFKSQIVFVSHQSSKELRRIYGAALALTYVSYFEGFGIPIIEAFACGTPVITSNVTSMPEVAGDAAIIIDPFDIESMANALYEIERNIILREILISRGLLRCKLYSWDDSSIEMWKAIEQIINNH